MPEAGPVCAVCLSPIAEGEATTACPACQAVYHADCWQENGGCAVYGCSQVPAVEQRRSIEIPVSYWGQENKKCPKCGQEILAAAVRCRHCGATFESARPQAATEFQRDAELSERLPKARRTIIINFILSVITCLAPIGALLGLLWYNNNREELRKLPTVYDALCKIGLAVGIVQTFAIVFLTILYAVVRH